jgi:hypothetical protein
MKRFNLFIFVVLFFFLFSCAGAAKGKKTENNEQVTEDTAKQTSELVKDTEKDTDEEQIKPDEPAVNAGEEPAKTANEPAEEPLNAEIAQADTEAETSENAESLSAGTEPAALQETANETPSVTQTAAEQTQSPEQSQQEEQSSLTQLSSEGETAVSQAAPPDNDSQTARESTPARIDNNPLPAARIESLTQMGTMPYDNEIIFSRIVHASVGQIVEIPFRGNGWVYMDEIASRRGITLNSKHNDPDGQSFIFSLEEAGIYVLKFYRRDFIKDYIIIDHIQLIVEEAQSAGGFVFDRGRVVAQPRWPSAVEEAQISRGARPASEPVVTSGISNRPAQETSPQQRTDTPQRTNPAQRPAPVQETSNQERTPSQDVQASSSANTGGQTAQSTPVTNFEQNSNEAPPVENREKLTPEATMQKARQTFDSGNIQSAIDLLNQLMADYPDGGDEVYWLLGQYYEANSPARNILLSLDYYRRLVNEYPQSDYFNDARRRIAYLERFYINIQ